MTLHAGKGQERSSVNFDNKGPFHRVVKSGKKFQLHLIPFGFRFGYNRPVLDATEIFFHFLPRGETVPNILCDVFLYSLQLKRRCTGWCHREKFGFLFCP